MSTHTLTQSCPSHEGKCLSVLWMSCGLSDLDALPENTPLTSGVGATCSLLPFPRHWCCLFWKALLLRQPRRQSPPLHPCELTVVSAAPSPNLTGAPGTHGAVFSGSFSPSSNSLPSVRDNTERGESPMNTERTDPF